MAYIKLNLGELGEQTYDVDVDDLQTVIIDEDYKLALKCINNLNEYAQIELLKSLKREIEEKLEDMEDKE